jgi:protein-tyrosine phosphatase
VSSEHFTILFVCTGNVCRSVLAERLARRGIRARLGDEAARFAVRSAGTAARDGEPMHPYTRHALAGLDADTGGFASRQLTAGGIDAADLILSACAEHRNEVLGLRPAASTRSYLLREFARLAAAIPRPPAAPYPPYPPPGPPYPPPGPPDPVQRARDAVAAAARMRGRVPYVEPAADEIADPAADPEAFGICAKEIEAVVSPVLDVLCGSLG